jgi:hypothetical protein
MLHKFKIGAVVNYRPKDRVISALRGTYIVAGLNRPFYRVVALGGHEPTGLARMSHRPPTIKTISKR